jgi:hypothetical protein
VASVPAAEAMQVSMPAARQRTNAHDASFLNICFIEEHILCITQCRFLVYSYIL